VRGRNGIAPGRHRGYRAFRPSSIAKDRLARVADFRHGHQADKGSRPAYPPPAIVNGLLSNEEPPLPLLRRVVKVPVFAPDGRLLAEPGYDVASGILYWPPKHFAVPAVSTEPAAGELDKARELILGASPWCAHRLRIAATRALQHPSHRGPVRPLCSRRGPAPCRGPGRRHRGSGVGTKRNPGATTSRRGRPAAL